ncbi:Sec1-binding region of Mso1-domain-containing protein [Annulohypoxylon truncatum]|uniref:Sec1-binding region of Mso1-domain-containing protein n=1 Tax=Annulohypoxylon truncatum TaxID=327061 RepID=UPI002007F256|nr:Sec1-binding region of Mso1-domain-containing protein [Annulohypoxylon truncatum]KAI1214822.1 Sec1-binding region of Mso1-domain-containing protein [Annulohypoxylon truncatum]
MSAWYSNIVGATSSKISNLQRTFLNSEADGDTEDDTHVCRVLRSYYIEKGQPLPGWLPPDPKAPPPVAAVYSQPQAMGSRYGGLTQQPQGGGLSSLWDSNPVSQPQDAQSLRRGRGAPPAARMGADPRGSGSSSSSNLLRNDDVPARPLPSQRAGSYQNTGGGAYARDTGTAPPAMGGSAQDRLKQRLFGGSRTASPAGSGPFNPPPQQGGGGGGGGYEDRFAPGGMYDGGSGGRSAGRRAGISGGGLPSGPRMR